MTNETLPQIVCTGCGRKIPRESRFCLFCGKVTTRGPKARPKSLTSIAFFGIITAVMGLISAVPSSSEAGPSDAYQIFSKIFGWLGLPLNILLLAACAGLWGAPRPWARRWMLWWVGLITIYETAQLLLMVFWIGPKMNRAVQGDLAQINTLLGTDAAQTLDFEYCVYWISMMSLAVWAWWVLRRASAKAYFEPQYESDAPPVS